ncbi:hypothetical protein B0H34DRAFT_275954 [Crassisporium funariophilum]|nr:hypothetical protein B0H34DRAFT_275954 [Crassisporium funariophilum]
MALNNLQEPTGTSALPRQESDELNDILNEVLLISPDDSVNLDRLAESTVLAFNLLLPWCLKKQSLPVLNDISSQAKLYVKAIASSIDAAQGGYNVAEEALRFAKLVDEQDAQTPVSSKTEKERQAHLQDMVKVAAEGHRMAEEALENFRCVRQEMSRLIDKAKNTQRKEEDDQALLTLESNISVLERFSQHIAQYTNWWGNTELLHSSLEGRTEKQVFKYSQIRHKDIIERWNSLKQGYTRYTDTIQVIQDTHADIFKDAQPAESEKKPGFFLRLLRLVRKQPRSPAAFDI